MLLKAIKPRKALNKAYLKLKLNRNDIEKFKKNLIELIDRSKHTESEEFHKNLVADFLRKTYYDPENFINTKGRSDLVVYNAKDAKSTVGVIIETKKPTNKFEMLSKNSINVKAFHELILYFLRERIGEKNLDLKHIIATNINEWFVFEAHLFEKLFAQNKNLVKQFTDFEEGRLGGKSTDFFYNEVAKPFVDSLNQEIVFTHFDLRDFEKPLRNNIKEDDTKLIALYKLFSPEHLLKLPFVNDSNNLDKKFYSELLHIVGLAEIKQGSKKLIGRKPESERNNGSLIENVIIQLDSLDKISRLENPKQYGENHAERLFSIGLELCITWINRILFLKLLEAQLLKYHKGNKEYAFLNIKKIQNYDDLNTLFFQVLAKKPSERNSGVKDFFTKVPFLNSSLFEPTEIEHTTLFISNLQNDQKLNVLNTTILKETNGKRITGELNTLQYFFEFLDAYDFSSEGAEDIQEENKTLINASVLGLIFEKINGYKDGSFFTPGFITMYMCRETIRLAVVQKFNDAKGWHCESLDDVYNKELDLKEANIIINSLKICDPAVGSGHFLVSALNEVIAVKNDLRILLDREGKRLKEYHFEVVNDELVITDNEGELFEYHPAHKESQRVQEALFHEKQTIIENCLFGVDINPNSVKICRLRLWIELLKNAYYKNNNELETLPNIDINIKCGNSLISRFALDSDLKQALKKSKWTIDMYRITVQTYRNAKSKEEKHDMERLIKSIKTDFKTEIGRNDPAQKRIDKLAYELFLLTGKGRDGTGIMMVFEDDEEYNTNKKLKNEKIARIRKNEEELNSLIAKKNDMANNKIYENAFEWRFEFPEVLNDDGDFIGFDVCIGNPPYGLFNKKQNQKVSITTDELAIEYLKLKYPEATGGVINAARMFIAFSFSLCKFNGFQCMIIPYGILTDTTSVNLRKHIFNNYAIINIDAFPERDNANKRVFEDVKMSTVILLTRKGVTNLQYEFELGISYDKCINKNKAKFKPIDIINLNSESLQIPLTDNESFSLLVKIYKNELVSKFKNISPCLTGEIDMTFGKQAISKDNTDVQLLKGVQLDRFIIKTSKSEISQGEIEFISLNKIQSVVSLKKLADSKFRRIALQGLTGVNEKRRLKASIVPENIFLANSCNYLLENNNYKIELLLAYLNSKLLNFVFKCKSTSSNVNGYEVDDLPFVSSPFDNKIIDIVSKILVLKNKDIYSDTTDLESQIDRLVYELYGLTEEEIAIVEGTK